MTFTRASSSHAPAGSVAVGWRRYAALGDSLTAGRGDPGPDGRPAGWAQRLAAILSGRTAVPCDLTNLAADGAGVATVLRQQLPGAAAIGPDLVSVTVGMNDVRLREFSPDAFGADLGQLLDGLAATGATILTCTLPDISAVVALPAEHVAVARQRLREASDIIRRLSARYGARCLDTWAMPDAVADPALFTADRLHPNARGHRALAMAFAGLLLDD
jgi:lysophospholipase L1-like esterase